MKNFLTDWDNLLLHIRKTLPTIFDKCKNHHELNVVKNNIIGKNSSLRKIFSSLDLEQKKKVNSQLKEIKMQVQNQFNFYMNKFIFANENKLEIWDLPDYLPHKQKNGAVFTYIHNEYPEFALPLGISNPLNLLIEQIHQFFQNYGFQFRLFSEIETVQFNFDFLNIPLNHPSRQKTDTFYLNNETVLRTHATNVTARLLTKYAKNKRPIFAYTLGNVYRNDTNDMNHMNRFLQLDACVIGHDLSLANLKWFIRQLINFLFDKKIIIRFRTNYFPFTEPSFEVDIKKQSSSKWTEILGAGIITPAVLKNCGIKEQLSVIALGMGLERLAMLKYDIHDIRDLYRNNLIAKM